MTEHAWRGTDGYNSTTKLTSPARPSMPDRDIITAEDLARELKITPLQLADLTRRGLLTLHPARSGKEEGPYRREDVEVFKRLFVRRGSDHAAQEALAELEKATDELEEKRAYLKLLKEHTRRTETILDMSHDVIWETDAAGRFTFLNRAAEEMFEEPIKRLIGRCFFSFEVPGKQVANRRFLAALRRCGEVRNFTTSITTPSGMKWLALNARAILNTDGEVEKMAGTIHDITEQHAAEQRLVEQTRRDPLTGLYHRAALTEHLEAALRGDGHGALLTVNIDFFDVINETFGPREGDEVLKALARALKNAVRDHEQTSVYNLGGDEFAVLTAETSRKAVAALGERLREAVRGFTYFGDDRSVNYTACVSVVLFPFHGDSAMEVMRSARVAMRAAKDAGRNRLQFYEEPQANSLKNSTQRQSWYQRIQKVLASDRLVLFSQPICRLKDGTPVHEEVLARLREGEHEQLLAPAEFMPHAEETGLIKAIDEAVIRKTIETLKSDRAGTRRFFVNLARASITDPAWVRGFLETLRLANLPRGRLVFEITETAAMRDIDVTAGVIAEVKALGQQFALEDLGARFSSFDHMGKLDVDYIKINGELVRNLAHTSHRRVMVRAICEIAHQFRKQVIATSVEDSTAQLFCAQAGAQYGQGMWLGRPAPIDFRRSSVLREVG